MHYISTSAESCYSSVNTILNFGSQVRIPSVLSKCSFYFSSFPFNISFAIVYFASWLYVRAITTYGFKIPTTDNDISQGRFA